MPTTIKDVAKKAKVSIATVSLVIHDHKKISSETKQRVNRAIKDLNYHPSRSARGLVSKKTGNIGFILTEDHFLRSEPFYTRIFLGTEFEARYHEYYILLTTIPSTYNSGDRLPRFVLERNVDGVIIAGKVPQNIILNLEKYKLPLAFVDYYSENGEYPVVLIDNVSGGIKATDHLIKLGHKKIAFIGGDIQHPSIRERFHGYQTALNIANIPINPKYHSIGSDYPNRENGYKAAEKLFTSNKEITAAFACNDAMAIGVLHYLKDNGIRIPQDVSIIGFDDVEADLSLDPPLTTVKVPKIEMGIEVLRLMNDILKKQNNHHKKILIPVELVERKSTASIL